MTEKEYLNSIGIILEGHQTDDAYIIDLKDSNEYGKMFSKLESIEDLDLLEDNQVITEQGSSLIYESYSEDYIINLIADFDSNQYQLIVNKI